MTKGPRLLVVVVLSCAQACSFDLVDVPATRGWTVFSIVIDGRRDPLDSLHVDGWLTPGELPFGVLRTVADASLAVLGVQLPGELRTGQRSAFGTGIVPDHYVWDAWLPVGGARPLATSLSFPEVVESARLAPMPFDLVDATGPSTASWVRGAALEVEMPRTDEGGGGELEVGWVLSVAVRPTFPRESPDELLHVVRRAGEGPPAETLLVPSDSLPGVPLDSVIVSVDYRRRAQRTAPDSSYTATVRIEQWFEWRLPVIDSAGAG